MARHTATTRVSGPIARRPVRGRIYSGGFTPFHAPDRPPPGTYDPGLDAQLAAAGRGYGDLTQDTDLANARGQDDLVLQTGDLKGALDRALADAKTNRDRGHADFETQLANLGTARTREGQDYSSNIGTLHHNYDVLGGQQTDEASAAGVAGGGALMQALQKRLANQARDQAPIDTAHTRAGEDFAAQETGLNTGEQRAQQDYETFAGSGGQGGRAMEDFNRSTGALGLALTRANEDRATTLGRAGRENTMLGADISAQRFYQAAGQGYVPPERPRNEHTDPRTGQTFRLVRTPGGQLRRLLPTGQLVRRPSYSLRKPRR